MSSTKTPRETAHVIHTSELEWSEQAHGDTYASRFAPIASRIGAQKLGYRLVELPPGKAAFPGHYHFANEEMFYVLEGSATLRLGEREVPIAQGDFISVPCGEQSLSHQIVNTSSAPVRYLAVSTMLEPDVVVYPESGKFAVYAGSAPGGDKRKRSFEHVGRLDQATGYWSDEK